jgi:hypothetical protein
VGDGLAITMEVSGLAPNPPGSVYECWYVGPGDTLGVTLERDRGNPARRGDKVLVS